jgi:hypothetical protein
VGATLRNVELLGDYVGGDVIGSAERAVALTHGSDDERPLARHALTRDALD